MRKQEQVALECTLSKIEKSYDQNEFSYALYQQLQKLITEKSSKKIINENKELELRFIKAYINSIDFISNTLIVETLDILCNKIDTRDYFSKYLEKPEKTKELSIHEISNYSNTLSTVVANTLFEQENLENRILALEHWIRIANKCMSANPANLWLVSSIIAPIESIWPQMIEKLSKEDQELFSEMVNLTINNREFYLNYIKKNVNTVPIFSMFQTILIQMSNLGEMSGHQIPNENNSLLYREIQSLRDRIANWRTIKISNVNQNKLFEERLKVTDGVELCETLSKTMGEKINFKLAQSLAHNTTRLQQLEQSKLLLQLNHRNELPDTQLVSDLSIMDTDIEVKKIEKKISEIKNKVNFSTFNDIHNEIYKAAAKEITSQELAEKNKHLVKKILKENNSLLISPIQNLELKITAPQTTTIWGMFAVELSYMKGVVSKWIYANRKTKNGDPMDVSPIKKAVAVIYLMLQEPDFFNPGLTDDPFEDEKILLQAFANIELTKVFLQLLSLEELQVFNTFIAKSLIVRDSEKKEKIWNLIFDNPILPSELKVFLLMELKQFNPNLTKKIESFKNVNTLNNKLDLIKQVIVIKGNLSELEKQYKDLQKLEQFNLRNSKSAQIQLKKEIHSEEKVIVTSKSAPTLNQESLKNTSSPQSNLNKPKTFFSPQNQLPENKRSSIVFFKNIYNEGSTDYPMRKRACSERRIKRIKTDIVQSNEDNDQNKNKFISKNQ